MAHSYIIKTSRCALSSRLFPMLFMGSLMCENHERKNVLNVLILKYLTYRLTHIALKFIYFHSFFICIQKSSQGIKEGISKK